VCFEVKLHLIPILLDASIPWPFGLQALVAAFEALHALYGNNPDLSAYVNEQVYLLPPNTPLFRQVDRVLEAHVFAGAIDFYTDARVGTALFHERAQNPRSSSRPDFHMFILIGLMRRSLYDMFFLSVTQLSLQDMLWYTTQPPSIVHNFTPISWVLLLI
jgi:hypothetical protein